MGMFDTISVAMRCPLCDKYHLLDAQTKDLQNELYRYSALPSYWFDKKNVGKTFREQLSCCPSVPLDKSHTVWADQAERLEAGADTQRKDLSYVEVIVDCPFQEFVEDERKTFEGKIKMIDGLLIGEIYDIIGE